MTRKTHDAELCERIRELEKRVEELEARPTYVPTFTHYCYPGCPMHYGTTAWPPYITWNTTTTAKGVSTDSTVYTVGDIS